MMQVFFSQRPVPPVCMQVMEVYVCPSDWCLVRWGCCGAVVIWH